MNREQRRSYNKKNKTAYTKQEFDIMLALARLKSGTGLDDEQIKTLLSNGVAHLDNEELVPTGTEVKINAKEIIERNKNDLTEEFIAWVSANKDNVFHLEREENKQSLVCLREDVRQKEIDGTVLNCPKWLFDLYSDILVKYNDEWIPVYEYDQKLNSEEKEEAEESTNAE